MTHGWKKIGALGLSFLTMSAAMQAAPTPADPKNSLAAILEQIRAKYKLPALGGAMFTTDGLVEMAVTGVRKAGTTVEATTKDEWHLGSDTKMMTALLAGTFVVEGKLAWDAKVATFFPEAAAKWPAAMQQVTLGQVLQHQAGLTEKMSWGSYPGNLTEQRRAAALDALLKPAYAPGAYHYANADYVVAAAILEKISGQPWEKLMQERIFQPLHMDAAGFGGLGTPGQIDQPWPHKADGTPMPENGPLMDNAPAMWPAGAVHCTMEDWAKFLMDQLRGGTGKPALLPANIYAAMQTPGPGSQYGYGWMIGQRPWADGKVLSHAGSNTMNYAVCWLAPGKNFGVLVCTNQGGDTATKACDDASWALIQRYLAKQQTP